MALLVKELCSAVEPTSVRTWIHPSGNVALLFEGSAELSIEAWVAFEHWLDEIVAGPALPLAELGKAMLEFAPWVAAARGSALIAWDGRTLRWLSQGSVAIVRVPIQWRLTRTGLTETTLAPPAAEVSAADDFQYIVVPSAVPAGNLAKRRFDAVEPGSYVGFSRAVGGAAGSKPWRALIFPAEYHASYANPSWSRVRFAGAQEDRLQELWGLRAIGDALDSEPDFEGTCIVGGLSVEQGRESVLGDGVLLSPYGIFVLELKHWFGQIRIPAQTEHQVERHLPGKTAKLQNNPLRGLRVYARNFSKQFKLEKYWVSGLLVFTYPGSEVVCLGPSGETLPVPHRSGDVGIGFPSHLAELMRGSAGGRPRLSHDDIASLVNQLAPSKHPPAPSQQSSAPSNHPHAPSKPPRAASRPAPAAPTLRIGRFLISPEPIREESTPYCDVLDVRVEGRSRRLWAKRYALNPLTSNLELEAARVGREVDALQDLSDLQGFYKYIDRAVQGHALYVIVEAVPGLRFDSWLGEKAPSREEKLRVLRELAQRLAVLAERNIVHRALSPAAVRVSDARLTVVNFDLCQSAHLATVEERARQQLDPAYLSLEASTPGRKLEPADDTVSFGKLVCLALTGELPFTTPAAARVFMRKPVLWNEYGAKHGLTGQELSDIRSMVAPMREQRPVGAALVEVMNRWQ